MSTADKRGYAELQDVIMDPSFAELDLALRRGRHVDREDFAWYTLLTDAGHHLEPFYRRYGCELIHKADGYYYLLPSGEKLSRKQLGTGDMLVGQALALLYLDPATIERGGRITAEDVVAQLVVVLGSDALIRAFNPHLKRRHDERVAQKNVRNHVAAAIRHLATLGFVDVGDDGHLRLRPALLRFAEPVRGLSAPAEALAKLVAQGEVALVAEMGSDTTSTTFSAPDRDGDDEEVDGRGDDEVEPDDGATEFPPASDAGPAELARAGDAPDGADDDAADLADAVLLDPEAPADAPGTLPLLDLMDPPGLRPTAAPLAATDADDDDPPYVFADDDDREDDA